MYLHVYFQLILISFFSQSLFACISSESISVQYILALNNSMPTVSIMFFLKYEQQ